MNILIRCGVTPLLVEYRITWPVIVFAVLIFIFPFLADLHIPLFNGMLVTSIEAVQALLLLFFAIFTYVYMKPLQLKNGQKQFWLWAIFWWVLLFGRSTSWGRDYFPDVPRSYFRVISIFVIAPVVFMLFSPYLRHEIVNKLRTAKLSAWAIVIAVLGLIIADSIEHGRLIAPLFLHNLQYQDFMEELYEFPLIIGLFLIALPIMKQDKRIS
ncbi:hypothetical protein A6M14_00745 [Acinetobacter sp. Ac_877]|nr:hypothetical protein [Acinetobacter portensis]